MSNLQTKPQSSPKKQGVLIPFLGSMNLAVTLLVMLAIASVIGTILKQDESLQDYIIKFGPFWADVFHSLGLYHVYGAAWFILVLVFLLISTGTCLTRNTIPFLKEIKQFSEKMSITAYQHQPYHTELEVEHFDQAQTQAFLEAKGYKTKLYENDQQITVAGIKGRWNRLGYIFTHAAIIIICIGALLDSNLLLKYRELTGSLAPETRAVPIDQIPKKSWLGPNNFSFRGTVNIPEGQSANVLFLPYETGFLVQQLPFTLKVKDFRVRFYDTGMPKSFESDVVLTAPGLKKPIVKTISVNHPLLYKNYAIYQSSFGDGGSKLDLKIYPLLSPKVNPLVIHTQVKGTESLKTPVGTFKLEMGDFKLFNIVPATQAQKAKNGHKMHNNGPSIIFKVRNDQGIAWEYENYMQPSLQKGRLFFMTGVRTIASQPYRYLFIPADKQKSKARFFKFLALINNPIKSAKIIKSVFVKPDNMDNKTYRLQLKLMGQLLTLFRARGLDGITQFVQKTVPKKDQQKVSNFYFSQTTNVLQTLYLALLKDEKENLNNGVDQFDQKWFEDALTAMSGISKYGPPMYVELTGFKQIQSTGIQITKSPGKDVVFSGSALLVLGIFFLFYLRQKHIWFSYSKQNKTLTIAGKDRKDLPETQTEFNQIIDDYKEELL